MTSAFAFIFPFNHPVSSGSMLFPISKKTWVITSCREDQSLTKALGLCFCELCSPFSCHLLGYFKHMKSSGALRENKHTYKLARLISAGINERSTFLMKWASRIHGLAAHLGEWACFWMWLRQQQLPHEKEITESQNSLGWKRSKVPTSCSVNLTST